MEFDKRKRATLATINSPEPDKSPKGNIDTPIIPLLTTINSHPCFFTTSSCSGRISVLSTPTSTTTTNKKAKGGNWVFITHDPADPTTLLSLLFNSTDPPPSLPPSTLVFRYEPLIIAVECRDIVSAQSLVSLAISCGFRESGITSVNKKRVIVAIRCSIRLEVPLGDTNKLMVSREYVEFLVKIANDKMEANRKRTDNFLALLLKNGFSDPNGNKDSVVGNQEVGVKDQTTESFLNFSSNGVEGDDNSTRRAEVATSNGSQGVPEFSLSINQIEISGEPVERLYIWGHSACTLTNKNSNTLLIFGGFGGMGRHARRNDSMLLDPVCGKLELINLKSTPCPRLGHTASLVGDEMFVIGGRADPVNILNDVWGLNTSKNEWRLLQCTGSTLPPSHRHAAAVVGSNIYVYGGIHNDIISSSLYVLDTQNFVWSEICTQGEKPSPRHSHSLVAHESRLFLFGGYDGEKSLGDLYTFDFQRSLWKKENVAGRTPYARFSHSMFAYKNYIGIIGGCPIRQHCQELSLLDLQSCSWKHIMLNSIGEDLFVRCTASVVGNDLVIVGGGASCYAFGTKFNEPMRVDLLPLMSLPDISNSTEIINNYVSASVESIATRNDYLEIPLYCTEETSNGLTKLNTETDRMSIKDEHQKDLVHWILQLGKQHAKPGKDILKKFGWLDLGRKVYSQKSGVHICFPVTKEFITVYQSKQSNLGDASENLATNFDLKEISPSAALNLLVAYGGTTHQDSVVIVRKPSKSPLQVMQEAVASLVNHLNLPSELLEQLPTRWDRLGDIVVLPVTSFKDPAWDSLGKELWLIVAEALGARRLARQGRISPTGTRDSTLEILVGNNGWVEHRENGILYSFDATKCMFSWGNLSEKLRVARLNCKDEVIVDLFAGIGYFTLPFLVRANASKVYACEWNPHAVEALQRNLLANSVADRCVVLEGDNCVTAPKGVADRVSLGLLPTSEGSWVTAVRALRSKGGVLHVHGNVKDTEEDMWTKHVSKSFEEIAKSEGYNWVVSVEHVERVKWYAPHIRHLVADVRCQVVEI